MGVAAAHVRARMLAALDLGQREVAQADVGAAGRLAEQPLELPLGRLQGAVGHVVDQADHERRALDALAGWRHALGGGHHSAAAG